MKKVTVAHENGNWVNCFKKTANITGMGKVRGNAIKFKYSKVKKQLKDATQLTEMTGDNFSHILNLYCPEGWPPTHKWILST